MNKIDLDFSVKSYEDTCLIFYEFLKDSTSKTAQSMAKLISLGLDKYSIMPKEKQFDLLKGLVKKQYDKYLDANRKCLTKFSKLWSLNKEKIEDGFTCSFKKFKNQRCHALSTFNNVIFPRYLDEKSFDFTFDFDEEAFLLTAIHEITHFIWFDKVKQLMPEVRREDYESPSPIWLFSEIAVDIIFENSQYFKSIAQKIHQYPAYDYFYVDKIGSKTVIEYFRNLYKHCKNVDEFIILGTKEAIRLFNNK